MAEGKQSTEGLPMFVESTMNLKEWNERIQKYPSSHKKFDEVNKNKTNLAKWRFKMGDTLGSDEISRINTRLDELKLLVKP